MAILMSTKIRFHSRGMCPVCGADVAVSSKGTAMAHGRKARMAMGLDGKPYRSTTYGCSGWGQKVMTYYV